jgi:hypothetical protein
MASPADPETGKRRQAKPHLIFVAELVARDNSAGVVHLPRGWLLAALRCTSDDGQEFFYVTGC